MRPDRIYSFFVGIRPILRRIISVCSALALFFAIATLASAHPLGNFTINHYARLQVAPAQLRVRYVLDFAEIPTFQTKQQIDTDTDRTISELERRAFLGANLSQWRDNLELTINDQAVPFTLEPDTAQAEFFPGQGGLETMRVTMWFSASHHFSSGDNVEFRDNNFGGRLGWREIVALGLDGITLENSNVPTKDQSQELTAYPADLLTNPPNVRETIFGVALGASASSVNPSNPITTGALGAFDRTRDEFGKLITSNQELSPSVLLLAFLAAMGLGALHSFSPGHGKAVVGAYLVGSRGNWQHAIFLGGVVTLTHTSGVYALGFATLFLSAYILPEQLFPWLGFISGLLVAIIGFQLFAQRIRAARSQTTSFDKAKAHFHADENGHSHSHKDGSSNGHAHQHETEHAHVHAEGVTHLHTHESAHVHTHADGTTHSHLESPSHPISPSHSHDFASAEEEAAHAQEHLAEIQSLEKPTWRSLLTLGISGGLLPCPSALVVMLSAIALGRVLYGLFLIVGFSLGLAGVLVATGLVLLYAGKYAGRVLQGNRVGVVMRILPIAGALIVAVLGIGIALDAFLQTGIMR